MATTTKTGVIKVTGVPEDLIRQLDDRVSERHYGGRSEYLRELMRRDLSANAEARTQLQPRRRSVDDIKAVFARIESRDGGHVQPLAPDVDVREIIYGDHD